MVVRLQKENFMKFRNIVMAIGLGVILASCAGMQPVSETDRTFERVFNVPNHSRDQIYTSIKIWIAENFRSAKSVIELDSKEDGVIIGNGVIPYPCSAMNCLTKGNWKVPFTMRVDIKDYKFKIRFSNIKLSWPASYSSGILSPAYYGPVNSQGDMDVIKPALLKLGDDIHAAIISGKSNDDW